MSRTLRVTGDYTVEAANSDITFDSDNVVVTGNLLVSGTTTTVNTTDTLIEDNIITLNRGELGAGVTLGTAGIEIDRGSLDDAKLVWNETLNQFEVKVGSGNANIFAGTLKGTYLQLGSSTTINAILDEDNFASDSATAVATQQSTKAYISSQLVLFSPKSIGEGNSNVTVDDTGLGTVTFQIDGVTQAQMSFGQFDLYELSISDNKISTTASDTDIVLDANGTGEIVMNSVTSLAQQLSNPASSVGYTQVYAKAPGGGGSGVYFSNTTNGSDELVSKRKAIVYGLIF
jgi:hypothetical protein